MRDTFLEQIICIFFMFVVLVFTTAFTIIWRAKYLIMLGIIIFLILQGCASEGGSSTSTNQNQTTTTENKPPVVIVTPPEEGTTTDTPAIIPKFGVKIDSGFYLSDGESMYLESTQDAKKAGSMLFAFGDKLIQFDSSGNTVSTETFSHVPARVKKVGTDLFSCVELSQQEAYDLGALYRIYTREYKNGVEISNWWENERECSEISTAAGNVFIKNQNGAYSLMSGSASIPDHVHDGAFSINSFDTVNKRVKFNEQIENYSMNYIFNAKYWIESAGVFYSEKGHRFSFSNGLEDQVTTLKDFNSSPYPVVPELPNAQAPTLLSVGESNGKLYWIECNSGWLFKYDPQTDTLEQSYRLYDGNGTHDNGINQRSVLKPLIVDSVLYFSNNGSIYKLEIETGFINIFYAGSGEVIKYK